MNWVTLIKDFKEKVGFSQTSPSAHTASAFSASSALSSWDNNAFSDSQNLGSSSARDKYELELDCKRFWEEIRSSNSEKEKEVALDQTVDAFCRLAKQ